MLQDIDISKQKWTTTQFNMAPVVHYSTKKISKELVSELKSALKSVDAFGSVEIYIQNSVVTQITTRNIRKTTTRSRI